jgi:hypothetical protein
MCIHTVVPALQAWIAWAWKADGVSTYTDGSVLPVRNQAFVTVLR